MPEVRHGQEFCSKRKKKGGGRGARESPLIHLKFHCCYALSQEGNSHFTPP